VKGDSLSFVTDDPVAAVLDTLLLIAVAVGGCCVE